MAVDGKTIDELIQQFANLVSQADAIRKQMKVLTRQIEAHAGKSLGMKSSSEIDALDSPPPDKD